MDYTIAALNHRMHGLGAEQYTIVNNAVPAPPAMDVSPIASNEARDAVLPRR